MAWNGRNESILGAKAENAQATDLSNELQDASKADAHDAVDAKKLAPAPAPIVPSVWNGKHKKIMGIRDPSLSKESIPGSEASSIVSAPTRPPSPTVSSVSSLSKKEQLVVISTPAKAQMQSKEDEGTNSTAGSSTTNTIDEDPALDVKVVNTEVVTSSVLSGNSNSSSEEKNDNAANAQTRSSNHKNVKNASGGANANANNANSRRQGNNKGARGSMNAGNNNNHGRQNNSRGNSGNGGNGRRRANNDQPICRYYARGLCTRGAACTFKHDPAHAPGANVNETSSNANPYRRSGTYPPVKNVNSNRNSAAVPTFPTKRVFDPHKARAIALAKEAQDKEDRSSFASTAKIILTDEKKSEEGGGEEPSFFSIDVECIATGYGSCAKGINDGCGNEGRNIEGVPSNQYNDRSHRYPGRIAMVDSDGNLLVDIIIRPPQDGKGVVSYLTPLTGLTAEMCLGADAKPLEEAVNTIKGLLPQNGILVGQAIDHDVEWLGLVPGKDFDRMLDISEIFRQRMPSNLSQAANVIKGKESGEQPASESSSDDPSSDEHLGFATRYRHFSLRHVCLNLLGEDIQAGVHNPITDAKYSLTLFHKYRNSSVTQLRIVRDGLHRAPITPSFTTENSPVIDGVCVSAAAYPYKRAARKIWRWYSSNKKQES